jgi:hypothetical protein
MLLCARALARVPRHLCRRILIGVSLGLAASERGHKRYPYSTKPRRAAAAWAPAPGYGSPCCMSPKSPSTQRAYPSLNRLPSRPGKKAALRRGEPALVSAAHPRGPNPKWRETWASQRRSPVWRMFGRVSGPRQVTSRTGIMGNTSRRPVGGADAANSRRKRRVLRGFGLS